MNEVAYDALRRRSAFIDLTGRGNLRVTGEDRVRLLHAMCTNHIEQLQPGTGCYAFFLSAQGRIVADVNLFCMPDYLLLDTEPESRDRLRDHLDRFIIADDVTITDWTEDTAVINIEGPESAAVLAHLGASVAHVPYSIAEWGRSLVAHTSYAGGPGYSIFLPREERSDLMARLGAAGVQEARLSEAEAVRLENGRARYGIDFSESNIPQETQLMNAVHFSKGCYLGQEIVERVRSRGQVNKLLTQVALESNNPPVRGAKVHSGDKDVGEITSAAYSPALAQTLAFGIIRAEALGGTLTVDGVSARVRRAKT